MQRIRNVYFFISALVEEFQAHPGNNGKTPEMDPIFSKDSAIPCFTRVQITKDTLFCLGRKTAFVAAVLQRVIEIDAAGDGGDVVEQVIVVASAGINTLCVVLAQLN